MIVISESDFITYLFSFIAIIISAIVIATNWSINPPPNPFTYFKRKRMMKEYLDQSAERTEVARKQLEEYKLWSAKQNDGL